LILLDKLRLISYSGIIKNGARQTKDLGEAKREPARTPSKKDLEDLRWGFEGSIERSGWSAGKSPALMSGSETMIYAACAIVASAAVVWTIPADLPGSPLDGAQMIVGLQGMVFTGVAVVRAAWFLFKNRTIVAQMATWSTRSEGRRTCC
jgi:hypothetical protein